MWAPRSWHEVTALVGSAEETSSLDFKAKLGSNQELAKDIAAMTLNGGVLVFGVSEDPATTKASAISKISLKQVEEKIRQVAGTRVAPDPQVDVLTLTENIGDTDGVVVVIVPASAQAPHQANDRYPRRSGTTTTYLEEPEVGRLYERRRDLAARGRSTADLLEGHSPPPSAGGDSGPEAMYVGVGRIQLVVTPLSDAVPHPAAPWLQDSLHRAYHDTVATLVPRLKWEQKPRTLDRLDGWTPRGTTGWLVGASGGDSSVTLSRTTSGAVLLYPAHLSLQATWPLVVAGQGGAGGYRCAYEQDVALAATIFLAFAGHLLSQIDGVGPLGCGIAFQGYDGAVSFKATQGHPGLSPEGMRQATDGRASTSASAPELREHPEEVARRLVDPWLVAFYEFASFWPDLVDPPSSR